jgi:hypothetical protein
MEEKNVTAYKTPNEMISQALLQGGVDLEKLEKLLGIQERYEANEARKSYHKAMAAFKLNPPKIDKDKTVSYGNTKYNHASLANVTDKIGEALSKCGLSASWTTKQNGSVSVTCKITHIQGHSEETTISAPADKSGSKNEIQSIGSTITYLERYTLLALTGLATSDMDDDGIAAGKPVELIDDKQINQILDSIAELNADLNQFLIYMKLAKLEDMTKADFPKAMVAIDAKRAKKIVKKTGDK